MATTQIDLTKQVQKTLPYGNGGTGATALTNHGVVVAGASSLSTVAPGTSGNILTSNGTDWVSTAPSATALTSAHIFVGNGSNLPADVAVSGDLTLLNIGAFTVATVGGSSAANVHAAELLANAGTSSNTNSTLVKRDSSGNFTATTITANLTGNASTATTATTATTANALAAVDATGQSAIVAINDATAGTINGARLNAIFAEAVSGTVDGSNVTFTLAHTPSGAIRLYMNGLAQHVGAGNDFTISGGTITYLTAPSTGANLEADYKY